MANRGITVIICTFNGKQRLSETITHIAGQTLPENIGWEVILADNASTDGSALFAEALWDSCAVKNVPFRVIIESQPGKLYALQHAVKAANYEYIVICDDDNWLSADYLKNAFELLQAMPDVGAIGGQGVPVTDGTFPEWFQHHFSDYAVGPQAKGTGYMRPRDVLWGAGLITKKSLYLKMYNEYPSFLPELGSVSVLSAEDTEYCMRLILKGYRLYYDAALIYHHFIPGAKLTTTFRDEKLLKGFTDANLILRKYYAAMRATIKTKGRPDIWLMLLLIAPLNYIFAFSGKRAEKARDTLFYLLPFRIKADAISTKIKAFLKE
ncbi:glycosyltransferase [Pedobacter hartonius]|uniref:Glycosyltransferase, GT2 family n=1 Tax=Pedobacter hartonius TaxID=425514 RepID=A0A1H3ZR16_9SPHI|nr:glycosyltransferase [Pedobacter hartonius]SEA25714.1 Glycosyltransferase, GT2 family [Pedobacter hartonius]